MGLRSRAVRTFGAALRDGAGRPATASGLYGRPFPRFCLGLASTQRDGPVAQLVRAHA